MVQLFDVPIPALDDQSPRDAAQEDALRSRPNDLIRELEAASERSMKDGTSTYDPSWMCSELNLDDRWTCPAHSQPIRSLFLEEEGHFCFLFLFI